MTKHLRLIMLSLLAMICMGGYSQVKSVTCTLAANETKCEPTDVTWKYSIGAEGLDTQKGVQFLTTAAGAKLTGTFKETIQITKVIVNAAKSGKLNATKKTIKVFVGDKQLGSECVVKPTSADYTFESKLGIQSNFIEINLLSDKSSKSHYVKTVTIEYKPASSQTPTTVTFTGLTGEGVSLINGKLDGKEFTGYTAVVADNVPGTIAYAASGDGVATVDKTTGEVTVYPNVSGTTTITATFTPDHKDTYAPSEESYKVTNTKIYTSIADLKKDITTVEEKSFVLNLTKAIVTYTNRNNVFIQDESAGILIYMNNHGLKAGNTFTGTVNVKAMLYKDLAEITSWTSTVTPTQSEVPEPVVVTLAELTGDNYSKYESVRCKVVGVTVTKGMNDQDGEISQNGTIMPVRGGVANLIMTQDAILDMIGYPTFFKGAKRFQVWKDSDMTEYQTVKEITLDENSDNIVEEAKNVNVTLKRTLVGDGDWNTLCVPFTLTEAQTKAAFGADVELRELESVAGNTLTFKKVNSVTANVPCLIKLSEAYAKDTYTFTGVNTVAAKVDDFGSDKVNAAISFIGIYSSKDVTEWATEGKDYVAYLGANNTFFKAKAGTKMKAFRAFFVIPENTPASAVKAVIDGNATGIEDLVIDGVKANGRVYNLNGQYVGNSLNGLQSGIYIQNGKKIVIK